MVDVGKYLDKSFTNPYLEWVAFEIRFPSSIQIIRNFSLFQEKINQDYPNLVEEFPILNLPKDSNVPDTMKKLVFSDLQENTKVKLSHNALTIIVNDYKKFSNFEKRIVEIVDNFISIPDYKLNVFPRIGLRYVNRYRLKSKTIEEATREIERNFQPMINPSIVNINEIIGMDIEVRKKVTDSIAIAIREPLIQSKQGNWEYILDFDAYTVKPCNTSDYKQILKNLRTEEKKMFLKCVNEDFMKMMDYKEA
jgi:uncharacterized protein (TIGR04255 family)